MAREVIDIIIQERGGRRVAQQVRDIGGAATGSAGAVQLLRGALRGLGAGIAVREVLRAIDSYQRMENQLRVVGYEQNQLNQAMNDLFDIAQRTRTPLEATVNLYGKLAQSAGELGRSQAQMFEFTELVGQSLAIQGTSTAGSRAALLQLSQAMGEGIVRAQEYNSLIENARPLLVAAAAGMDEAGGSVARLRSLVIEGKVSSQEFFDAVVAGGEILREQFGATVPTIGQALTKLNNTWTKFLGESALGQTILSVVSGTLIFLADNFETVAAVVIGTGAAIVAFYGGGVLGALISRTVTAAATQVALAGGFTAANTASLLAAGGLRIVTTAVRTLTAAIAANPIGALLAAAIALTTWLYNLRDNMVTFGGTIASVGSIVAEVWSRVIRVIRILWQGLNDLAVATGEAFSSMVQSSSQFFSNAKENLDAFLSNWGTSVDEITRWIYDGVNAWIGLHVGFVAAIGPTITQGIPALFKLAMAVAKNFVLDGLQSIINAVVRGLGSIGNALDNIPGIDGAGDAIRSALTVDFSDLRADTAALRSEMVAAGASITGAYQAASNVDYLQKGADAIAGVGTALKGTTQGIVDAAAARDAALNVPVEEFEFITPPGGSGGSSGGAGKKSKEELSAFQKAYKDLVEETTGALKDLVAQQQALDAALANGVISQNEYIVKQQDIRVGLAEWAAEGQNVTAAMREANEAILQLKIDSGEGSFGDGFLLGLSRMTEGAQNFTASTGQLFADYFSSLADGVANSIGRAIVYSEDLGEALSNVAKEALASLISAFAKLGIQWLINAAIGKSLQASAAATTTAQASAAAAAWAPAAALASLATNGANVGPALAAIASTTALSAGVAASAGAIGGFADGGEVRGPGGPRDDAILAYLSNKEFVVNAKAAQENLPLLNAINNGLNVKKALPAFADGGQALLRNTAQRDSERLSRAAERDAAASQRDSGNNDAQNGQQAPNDQTFVFLQDPGLVGQYMQTPDGRDAIIKVLTEEGVIGG